MQITLDEAARKLTELVEAVESGEEVIISKGDQPVAKLVPVTKSGFRFGVLADKLTGPIPDFLEPMNGEELALWEGRGDEKC